MKQNLDRSQLFRALARYHQAAIPLGLGLSDWAEELPDRHRKSYLNMARWIRAGKPLDEAGLISGVLLPWEAKLLAVGTVHGRLDRVLNDLAHYHETASKWWNRLKSRLMLPGALLVLGWLLLPLPDLLKGQLSARSYLMQNLLLVMILVFGWHYLRRLGHLHRWLDPFLTIPYISRPLWQYHRYRFLRQLATLYDAGVAILDALPIAIDSCDSAYLRQRWTRIETATQQGTVIADALHRYAALDDTGYSLVHTGEASGRLGEMLSHEAQRLEQELGLWLDGMADWLPRLVYLLVLLLLFRLF